jgi:hypothetical protein
VANTTIVRVKVAFTDLLEASTDLVDANSATIVRFGIPTREVAREFVAIGGTTDTDAEWATLKRGGATRNETYALALVVYTGVPGRTQEAATLRAEVLFGYVEAIVRANTTPAITGGGRVQDAELRRVELDEFAFDEGYGAAISAALHVQARV